ncbi:MAG: STM3941 family protein [Ktedonobacterales bacterium]
MQTDYPLRMYANPVKQFLLLLVSAAFVLIGLLMVRDPNVRADVFTAVMAYAAIIFFGLCTAVFLIAMLRYVVFRRPVLQIDAEEWSYKNPLAGKAQAVTWQNIRAIALCRQKGSRNSVYYLVVYSKKAQPRARAFAERFYPSLSGAAMSVPSTHCSYSRHPPRASAC